MMWTARYYDLETGKGMFNISWYVYINVYLGVISFEGHPQVYGVGTLNCCCVRQVD